MTQFKIGSVYREKGGAVVLLRTPQYPCWSSDEAEAIRLSDGYDYGARNLSDGVCPVCPEVEEYHLIPGELHNFNGEWLEPEVSTEQPRAPYFAEALEANPDEMTFEELMADLLSTDNAAMIARDGPARPAPVVIQEPAKTSHGPIAGLTFLGAVDHLFGTRFVHGD